MNFGAKRGRISPHSLCVDMFAIHAALLLKACLKEISGFLILGLKGRKVILLNDPLEPPCCSDLEGYSFSFLGYSSQKQRPIGLVYN